MRVDYKSLAPYVRYVHEVELPGGRVIGERLIYDHEFIFVVRGSGTLRIEDRVHPMAAGQLFYIRPHLLNEMRVDEAMPMRCFAVHFDYVYLGEALDFSPYRVYLKQPKAEPDVPEPVLRARPSLEPRDLDIPERLPVNNVHQFLEIFQELCLHFESRSSDAQLWLRSAMLRCIALIHRHLTTKEGVKIGHPHAETILQGINYMEKHFDRKITVSMLANQAMVSPKYYGTLFKEVTGQTVAEYLLRLRMEKAKSLFMQRKYRVQEVAEMVGIEDLPYFTKLFKKHTGISPKRFANMAL
jgi:AraC-like DNA-binding protein